MLIPSLSNPSRKPRLTRASSYSPRASFDYDALCLDDTPSSSTGVRFNSIGDKVPAALRPRTAPCKEGAMSRLQHGNEQPRGAVEGRTRSNLAGPDGMSALTGDMSLGVHKHGCTARMRDMRSNGSIRIGDSCSLRSLRVGVDDDNCSLRSGVGSAPSKGRESMVRRSRVFGNTASSPRRSRLMDNITVSFRGSVCTEIPQEERPLAVPPVAASRSPRVSCATVNSKHHQHAMSTPKFERMRSALPANVDARFADGSRRDFGNCHTINEARVNCAIHLGTFAPQVLLRDANMGHIDLPPSAPPPADLFVSIDETVVVGTDEWWVTAFLSHGMCDDLEGVVDAVVLIDDVDRSSFLAGRAVYRILRSATAALRVKEVVLAQAVRTLMRHGGANIADCAALDEEDPALHLCCGARSLSTVLKVLLGARADPNILRARDHSTPLFAAALNNNLQSAQLLVASGATREAKNSSGITPLAIAQELGHVDMVEFLSIRDKKCRIDVEAIEKDTRKPDVIAPKISPTRQSLRARKAVSRTF